jgi:hypothetical protein
VCPGDCCSLFPLRVRLATPSIRVSPYRGFRGASQSWVHSVHMTEQARASLHSHCWYRTAGPGHPGRQVTHLALFKVRNGVVAAGMKIARLARWHV